MLIDLSWFLTWQFHLCVCVWSECARQRSDNSEKYGEDLISLLLSSKYMSQAPAFGWNQLRF
jgi:hypothetical protein